MLGTNQNAVEQILNELDKSGHLFPQFELYKIEDHLQFLGRGGFSTVYEMFSKERPQRCYALKVIGFEKHTVSSQKFRETTRLQTILCQESSSIVRILDAKELSVKLDGEENVLEVHPSNAESWEEEGLHLQLILMEKLDQLLTKDRFRRAALHRSNLSEEAEIVRFAMQIGGALTLAHGNKILHRDVKLENIFWDEEKKQYKLGDFGIAKYVEDGNAETIAYTDGYGAPEIERRMNDSYNETSDIYSLGITLYLLFNELRFPGSDGYYAKSEIQYNPDFIFPAPKNASPEITRVIRKMCYYHPEDRYQSMPEVLSALAQAAQNIGLKEADWYIELADQATETFRDETGSPQKLSRKEEKPLTRAEQKMLAGLDNSLYHFVSFLFFLLLAALMVLMFKGLQQDSSMISNWVFWILPAFVTIEALLQKIKELHLFGGIIVVLFSLFSIYTAGFAVPHAAMLLGMLSGVPTLSLSSAFAVTVWIALERTGSMKFLDSLAGCNMGWLFLGLLIPAVYGFLHFRSIRRRQLKESALSSRYANVEEVPENGEDPADDDE